jgi:hypothetical protein
MYKRRLYADGQRRHRGLVDIDLMKLAKWSDTDKLAPMMIQQDRLFISCTDVPIADLRWGVRGAYTCTEAGTSSRS